MSKHLDYIRQNKEFFNANSISIATDISRSDLSFFLNGKPRTIKRGDKVYEYPIKTTKEQQLKIEELFEKLQIQI